MDTKKKLVTGSISRLLEISVSVLTVLLLTPFLLDNLGAEGYGLWILTLSFVGWVQFLQLGLPSAVQRAVAIALESCDRVAANTLACSSAILFFSFGLLSALLVFLLTIRPDPN